VGFDEPFKRLFTQGMIIKDGAKMSKSKGNVVSPDELIRKYGADTVRLYTLFIGPPEKDAEWSDKGVEGAYRFLKRAWNVLEMLEGAPDEGDKKEEEALLRKMHGTIKKVTEDIEEGFHFNTAISAIMELLNEIYAGTSRKGAGCYGRECLAEAAGNMVLLMSPFVPHIAEEMWERTGGEGSVFTASWPVFDKDMLITDTVVIPVQVNGKLRGTVELPRGAGEENVKQLVLGDAKISGKVSGKDVRKWIILPDKLVNIIV